MTSTAPAQSPAQHTSGNRGKQDSAHQNGGQDQQFSHKQNGRNPSFKKNYQLKNRDQDGAQNGNQEPREKGGRRRDRDDHNNEATGSPREDHRRGGNRRNREANANSNGKAEAGSPHIEQAKANGSANGSANANNATSSSLDEAVALQALVEDLQTLYPHVHPDKILQVIRKRNYDKGQSLLELDGLSRGEKQPWTAIVKGKPAKPPVETPAEPPAVAPPQENTGRRDKRRDDHPRRNQHQQNQNQQNQSNQSQQTQNQKQIQHQQHQQSQHSQPQYQHLPQYQQFPQQPTPTDQLHYQTQEQLHQMQLHQQLVQQHAMQAYQQPYPQDDGKGEDLLSEFSKAVERELAEVQRKNERLTILRNELNTIYTADKDHRTQLETQKLQLETDRQHFAEQLRRVESELTIVEQRIKSAEEDKRRKVDDLYRSFHSNGVLAIANN